jgi:sugar phosphate isomerase/epimerase
MKFWSAYYWLPPFVVSRLSQSGQPSGEEVDFLAFSISLFQKPEVKVGINREQSFYLFLPGGLKSMRLGIMMNAFTDKSWDEALSAAQSLGVTCVEPGTGGFVGRTHVDVTGLLKDKARLEEWVGLVRSRHLTISAISCHGNPLHPNPNEANPHIRDLDESIEFAAAINVPTINCFAGCPGAGEDAKYPNWITCPWPPYFGDAVKWQWEKKVIPFWQRTCSRIAGTGIRFAFEMHPGDVVYCPETLLMLREAVGETVGCNLDPSHLFWQGINPVNAIKKLGPAIIHCHAKDSQIDPEVTQWRGCLDWKHYSDVLNRAWTFRTVGYGHGIEFWNDFVSALRLVGFDGAISIEHEDPLMSPSEGMTKAVELLKKTLLFEDVGKMTWA